MLKNKQLMASIISRKYLSVMVCSFIFEFIDKNTNPNMIFIHFMKELNTIRRHVFSQKVY